MLLQYCHSIAATRFCCQKDPQEKCSLLPVAAIVLVTFAAISLEAILLPEMLPELGHAQWSFLFNFLFSNVEGNGANKENNFHRNLHYASTGLHLIYYKIEVSDLKIVVYYSTHYFLKAESVSSAFKILFFVFDRSHVKKSIKGCSYRLLTLNASIFYNQ